MSNVDSNDDRDRDFYLHKSLRERIKQLRMEWLFEEPCTYEDEDEDD